MIYTLADLDGRRYLQGRKGEELNSIDWEWICSEEKLSEEFMNQYKKHLSWSTILKTQRLSETFLRSSYEYLDYHWSSISAYQELSENFMNDFADKLQWDYIACNQKMSLEFILKHIHRIRVELLEINSNVDRDKLKELNLEIYQKMRL